MSSFAFIAFVYYWVDSRKLFYALPDDYLWDSVVGSFGLWYLWQIIMKVNGENSMFVRGMGKELKEKILPVVYIFGHCFRLNGRYVIGFGSTLIR